MNAHPAVFLGLGSNLGDRRAQLETAVDRLEERGVAVAARSALYLTEPVGGPPQGWFLNQVIGAAATLPPEALLDVCLGIERELGRRRTVSEGPRTLDLDLLLYGSEVRRTVELTLPHPRMHERRFVLVPLVQIAPGAVHPVLGLTAAEMLERCPDRSQVRPF